MGKEKGPFYGEERDLSNGLFDSQRIQWPRLSYEDKKRGRPTDVGNFEVDEFGQIKRYKLGDGIINSREFDESHRLKATISGQMEKLSKVFRTVTMILVV